MPSLAAKPVPFEAEGIIDEITPGNVAPAGQSGRFRVIEREIGGAFDSGDIIGDFDLTYKANVELMTQAGNLHGVLNVGPYVAKVNVKIEPIEWLGEPFASPAKININGNWTFVEGAKGNGTFGGWAIVILNPLGHVDYILASYFYMTGQWQP